MTDRLRIESGKIGGPVECLGMTFPSEEARRDHFLGLLAERLTDAAFRAQEGFPRGTDEAILAMSDPPYYTACPNPWFRDFVGSSSLWGSQSSLDPRKPFAADVSEGKNDPIYNAHSYHTKVPHKAVMRYILHYTNPGDVVFDGFCGTGMTGVASSLCGDKRTVESLGYRVESSGNILSQEGGSQNSEWKIISKVGPRKSLLVDLSPAASFIARNYNTPLDSELLKEELEGVISDAQSKYGWMYQTSHGEGRSEGRINYTVWSDVFTCADCAGELTFWAEAVDLAKGEVLEKFPCPHCGSELTKRRLERALESKFDHLLGRVVQNSKKKPVLINYSFGGKRFEKVPDEKDFATITKVDEAWLGRWAPTDLLPHGGETRRNEPLGVTHVHHFFTARALTVFSVMYSQSTSAAARLALLGGYTVGLRTARFLPLRWIQKDTGPMKPHTAGTLYIPSISGEQNWLNIVQSRLMASIRGAPPIRKLGNSMIATGSASKTGIPSESVDYIFLDPPFGSNLAYSELNFLWESWLKVHTNIEVEAVENKARGQDLQFYRKTMARCFAEAFRVLKPGRWMTVEFSNTQASVWNAIQVALQEAGFVVANVSALDKKQGTFKSLNNTTSVKQDLVISAYKPEGELELSLSGAGSNENTAWDFVRHHLEFLPVFKSSSGVVDFISERDPRIIFDRMVAWFVKNNRSVPLSSPEFQNGLATRFIVRDGMIFLETQVQEYDRKRTQFEKAPQMEFFVADERSAIEWLSEFLKRRPSTYQEVHPEFMTQLGAGWKKHETRPELSALLEDNFLRYDASADVPSQIHNYLSSNYHDLRNLEKSDPRLKAKAKDRWFVPDPNKAQDLEKKREKALLKEFEEYRNTPGRKLKEFRLEVLRAGFKAAWANKDYQTIVSIANKVPEDALQEDEKLLFWYDSALTRTGG